MNSVTEMLVRAGLLFGLMFAFLGTLFVLNGIVRKKKVTLSVIITVFGIVLMIPFILCEVHGEETVEVSNMTLYSMDGEYLYPMGGGSYEVCLKYPNEYYAHEFVTLNSINKINDNTEPRLQRITTYLRCGPFVISESVYNAFVPTIEY